MQYRFVVHFGTLSTDLQTRRELGSIQELVRASTAVAGMVSDSRKSDSDRLKMNMFLKSNHIR